LAVNGIPTAEQTCFDIYLQGPEWNNGEWFDALSAGSDHFRG
jgi:hypothetical protein